PPARRPMWEPPVVDRVSSPPPARRPLLELVIGKHSELLRHDHAPGVENELPQLVAVDGLETDDEPLEAHVGRPRAQELVRVRLERGLSLLLREGETHQRLVTSESEIDDLADTELDPALDEDFV